MNENTERKIYRLQENLATIRKLAGWTAEEFGSKIGVTKQTISNLENRKSPMNLTQYIAIRTILDYEIERNEENDILSKVIEVLVDKAEEVGEEDYQKIQEATSAVSLSTVSGATSAVVASSLLLPVFMPLGIAFMGANCVTNKLIKPWLKGILNQDENK